jgi:hypothetical protein
MATKSIKTLLWCAVLGSAFTLTSCMKSSNPEPVTYARLAFFSGSPVNFSTDIYKDNSKLGSNLRLNAGGILTTDPGNFKIELKKSTNDSSLTSITAVYDTLKYYTHVVFGEAPISMIRIDEENNFKNLASDRANFRFFNLSTDLGPVDLLISGTVVQGNRSYMDFTSGQYQSFSPTNSGAYLIRVNKAGTTEEIATKNDISLSAGHAYSIFLTGKLGNTSDYKPSIMILSH